MLAAYTLPLILLPVLDAPLTIFDVAVARCEEIVIGILCAALLNALLFPVSIRSVLITRLQDWLENSAAVARILLGAKGDPGSVSTYGERLVTSAAAVQSLLSQLPNDNAAHEMKAIADELHTRLLLLPPLIASVMDRMHAIRLEHGQLPLDLGAIIEDFEHWFATTADPGGEISAATLRANLAGLQAPPGQSVWSALIWANLMTRLVHLIDLWEDCLLLRDHIVAGRSRSPFTLRYRPVLGRNRYYDRSMMAFIAASAAFATFTAGLLWMWSGWTNGANAVSFVAIASCFFGSLDRPVPLIQTMLKWAMVAFSIAFLYVFIVLPSVPDFTALVIVLAPVFLLFGAFIPHPQMSLIGLITAANFAGDLALDGRWSSDFVTFVEGGIAVALGLSFASIWTRITRPFGKEVVVQRLLLKSWKGLADLADGSRRLDPGTVVGRSLDHLMQVMERMAPSELEILKPIERLAQLHVAYNVLALRNTSRDMLSAEARGRIDGALDAISGFFRQRYRSRTWAPPPPALLGYLDQTLLAVLNDLPHPDRDNALQALVGVRRALYPDMTGPALPTREKTKACPEMPFVSQRPGTCVGDRVRDTIGPRPDCPRSSMPENR